MNLEEIFKKYYIFILGIFPGLFYWLLIWTCYDIFWTSLIMIMLYYLLLIVFFFKFHDQLINNLLISKIESLIFTLNKSKYIIEGFISGIIEFIVLILLLYKYYPISLPIPNDIYSLSSIIYLALVIVFYSISNELISELYFNVFIKQLTNFKIMLIFDSILVFFQISFLTQNIYIIILCLVYNIIKENYKLKKSYNINSYYRIGNKLGYISISGLLLVLRYGNYNVVNSHSKNYWKG